MNDKVQKYVCPMHPEVVSDKPGLCPKCGGMKLVPVANNEGKPEVKADQAEMEHDQSADSSYWPLIVVVGLITLVTVVIGLRDMLIGSFSLQKFFSTFMAGFFLVFSGFKLLNVKGFAQGYSTYDLLARKVKAYGYVYPFIELTLGLSYMVGFQPGLTNLVTLIVMSFSGAGVAISVLKKRKFQCACLGTFLKVPLTTVTLIEDFGMAGMAGAMLLWG